MKYPDDGSESGNAFRRAYLDSILSLITKEQGLCDARRREYMSPQSLKDDPERYRTDIMKMLGWPLSDYRPGTAPIVKTVYSTQNGDIRIDRLQLEVFPGLLFYGILFSPARTSGRLPLVISQHGGLGTPELCSGMEGSSANYNDMTQRVLSRGVVVFAPQLLLWDKEKYGNPYDRIQVDSQLKQLGGSITALEITCIRKSIDYLITLPFVDKSRIGMIGLSYGGFYTLFTAAAETRIRAAYSSCAFNSRYAYPWADWTWRGSAGTFLDAEVAALCAPRALWLEVGSDDELFDAESARREFERVTPFYAAQGALGELRFDVFQGTHELCRLDAGLDFFIRKLKI